MTARAGRLRRRRGYRRERGFTLVEVLISILLSVVAIVGIMGLYRVQTRSSSFSRHNTEATAIAENTLEELRTEQGSATPGSAYFNEVGSSFSGSSSGMFQGIWTMTAQTGYVVGTVQVSVNWVEEGGSESVQAWGEW
jgi:Tfp pilus assembly protein PilV